MSKTARSVGTVITDEQLGHLTRRLDEIKRRASKGTIPFGWTMEQLQGIIEGQGAPKHPDPQNDLDLDADPYVPQGWSVVRHIKGGKPTWNPDTISLHLDEEQMNGRSIEGNRLREKLANSSIILANANLLDWLLRKENQHLVPEEWKGKWVFFWGTIYRDSSGYLCVRCLDWNGGGWDWRYRWLDRHFFGYGPAAVLASTDAEG